MVNTVPGAAAIQEVIERINGSERVPRCSPRTCAAIRCRTSPSGPSSFSSRRATIRSRIRRRRGCSAAGDLADRATFYRHDRAFAADPTRMKDSHTFLIRTDTANMLSIALAAQRQLAVFLASDGVEVINPDQPGGNFFEVPISAGSLAELDELAYIP